MRTTYTLYVCPECGDAVSKDAARWGVPPEFMQFCRHAVGPARADLGRNVERISVLAVVSSVDRLGHPMSDVGQPRHRPAIPNEHRLAGERSRHDGAARDACPLDYPGSRWEWEAGWDHADYQLPVIDDPNA